MAGLGPAIHVFSPAKTWMRGSSPRMTVITSAIHVVASIIARSSGVTSGMIPNQA